MNKTTMDKKITQIEQNVAAQAIIPPPKLFDCMRGREDDSESGDREISRLFFQWAERVAKALESRAVTLKQVMDEIPEPFRSEFRAALLKKIDEE